MAIPTNEKSNVPYIIRRSIFDERVIEKNCICHLVDAAGLIIETKIGDGVKAYGDLPPQMVLPKPQASQPGDYSNLTLFANPYGGIFWDKDSSLLKHAFGVRGDGTTTEYYVMPADIGYTGYIPYNSFVVGAESFIPCYAVASTDWNDPKIIIKFQTPIPNDEYVWITLLGLSVSKPL